MNPREKAEDLIEKFQFNGEMIDDIRMSEDDAKQCALICAEVVVEELYITNNKIDFWQEVKQEIEKL